MSPIHGFAKGLRELREQAGRPTYRKLATDTAFVASTLARAASGRVLPSWELTAAYVTVCGGDVREWRGRWQAAMEAVRQRRTNVTSVPEELPAGHGTFAGRVVELNRLDALLAPSRRAADAPRMAAVVGTAGIGKTALATRWAHQNRRRFTDGQVCLDLQGAHHGAPLSSVAALSRILHALGVPRQDQPAGETDLIALYRSRASGLRLLLVLDNASNADQVRPLLPGGATCTTLITSQDDLFGLVAVDGISALSLEPLDADDAVALLTGIAGEGRPSIQTDTSALYEIAARCDYLPLALRIAGALLATRRHQPISEFRAELDRDPLNVLTVSGDSRANIRTAFASSLARLPEPARTMFVTLGLLPRANFSLHEVDAKVGPSRAHTHRLLDRLVAAHLVQRRAPGVYHVGGLLHRYAVELATARDLAVCIRQPIIGVSSSRNGSIQIAAT